MSDELASELRRYRELIEHRNSRNLPMLHCTVDSHQQ